MTRLDKIRKATHLLQLQLKDLINFGREPWSSGYWEETHVPKAVGLNPGTVYWIDIFHINLLLKL